jgi:1-deoxy-D-xylulose-5-phosphate reductoisomerase
VRELHFEQADLRRFPCLRLAREAGIAGSTYPTVLSAADEFAVTAFCQGLISFTGISELVDSALAAHQPDGKISWDSIEATDQWARVFVRDRLNLPIRSS